MTFSQAYNYLLSLQSLPRKEYMKDPKHCSIYLKRLQFFLDILGNPEKKIPHYIHVTGTSGKGSVCLMLNSILTEAGIKTGLSISPHPTCITERWQTCTEPGRSDGGKQITKLEFVELIEFIKPKLDEYIRTTPYDMLSFFEICEAIGFLYFVKKKVDWAILEVGCGGRYDASNVIPYKDIAVITNIGLDHTNIFGNDKRVIAYEKAGIIKAGCCVFTGVTEKPILDVIKKECDKNKAGLQVLKSTSSKNLLSTSLLLNKEKDRMRFRTLGNHQLINADLVIQIAKHLKIPEAAIKKGLEKIKLPIRIEVVSKKPMIILDGAHNPDKMKTTVQALKHLKKDVTQTFRFDNGVNMLTSTKLHLVVAFTADKNIPQMIKQLATLKPKSIACTRYTNNPFRQPANPKEIADRFKLVLSERSEPKENDKAKIEIFLDPQDAFSWSKKQSKKTNDILLVTGSMFLGGELKK
ncbi:hypothetical protein KJ785_02485 [Patescibacteria group bacterium]|nr:hypothetical protein [Patescibacteria group bacterium]